MRKLTPSEGLLIQISRFSLAFIAESAIHTYEVATKIQFIVLRDITQSDTIGRSSGSIWVVEYETHLRFKSCIRNRDYRLGDHSGHHIGGAEVTYSELLVCTAHIWCKVHFKAIHLVGRGLGYYYFSKRVASFENM